MRQLIPIKLTISQRLWLGLGVILVLFAAADLASLRASYQLDAALASLVDTGAQRNGAALAMSAHLEEMSGAVQQYMGRREPRQRERFGMSRAAFEQALNSYRDLASTERSRALGNEAAQQYARFRRQVDNVMQLEDSQATRIGGYDAHRRIARDLTKAVPAMAGAGREAATGYQRATAQDVAARVLRRAGVLELNPRSRRVDLARQLLDERKAFATVLAQYIRSAKNAGEREWAAKIDRWFAQSTAKALAIVEAEQIQRRAWRELLAQRDTLQWLLDDKLQPAARAELAAAVKRASETSHDANALITRGLLIALALAVLVALATSRAVHAPLRALVASSRRLAEGDFSYRAPVTSRDELGVLTTAFNEMAGKLQATTVSKTYMQTIVDSLGEALFVSRDGVIETANPAAEKLLGYERGGIVGAPIDAIASAGLDSTAAPGAASRVLADLLTRDGERVPATISAVQAPSSTGGSPAMICVAQDLRERLAAERRQRQAEVVFENTQEGIVLTDAQGNVVLVNPAFTRITGYAPHEVRGRPASVLWSGRDGCLSTEAVRPEVAIRGEWQGEAWLGCKDGEARPVWKNINVVRDESGRVVNYVSVFSDITALKHAEQRLNHLAYHDALTELPNRLLLAQRLPAALEEAQRSAQSVALLYLDLDDFKHVNDTLGHHEGDRLLQMVAERLSACVEAAHFVARLGGDEFVILVERVEEPRHAALVAERVLAALSAPLQLGALELRMRASIGISLGPGQGTTGEELLKAADAAMYRAKRSGRGTYEFFSAELTRLAMERLTLENALRHPDLHQQLLLEYQPQLSIATGRLLGVEALVRWRHPTRGLISPLQFIPVAEEIGLIRSIGDWVLQTACAQTAAWRAAGLPPLRVAVNVSAYQIRDGALVDSVRRSLQQTGLAPAFLELEVTEGALQTGERSTEVLRRLKGLGVKLAIDDFGTGYSALSSLKLLPFDRLKIDRSFVRDLEHDPNDRALVRAVIAMGRSLGLEIVAEGVEEAGQLTFLREEGCDEIQGFLVGAPMTAAELEEKLHAGVYRVQEPAVVHPFTRRRPRAGRMTIAS